MLRTTTSASSPSARGPVAGLLEQPGQPLGVVHVHLAPVGAHPVGALGALHCALHDRSEGTAPAAGAVRVDRACPGRGNPAPSLPLRDPTVRDTRPSAFSVPGVTSRPNGEPLVRLSGVNKWFGELHVLQDIDLAIDRGEVVVVIGPSGSGKSTLCRAINRLEPIDKGEITIDGALLPEEGKELARPAGRRRHGVPELQPLRPQDRARERHARTGQGARRSRKAEAETSGPGSCSSASASPTRPTSTRRSSPAASSSAWPSPARWPWSPR